MYSSIEEDIYIPLLKLNYFLKQKNNTEEEKERVQRYDKSISLPLSHPIKRKKNREIIELIY